MGPDEMLRLAAADLEAARLLNVPGQRHNACFHAQQAAEKALKAVLMALGEGFPKTHDLAYLVTRIRARTSFPPLGEETSVLNEYSVSTRYEPLLDEIDEPTTDEAVHLAARVVEAAKRKIEGSTENQESTPRGPDSW